MTPATRTLPVIEARARGTEWIVHLPGGRYIVRASEAAVRRLVAAEAPGSAIAFLPALTVETSTRLSPQIAARIRIGEPHACWLWMGPTDRKGYGRAYLGPGRTNERVHRVVLEEALGRRLGQGEHALHRCDNPPCCNPAHLYAGSPGDNVRDMVARGRVPAHMRPRPFCGRGHPLEGHNLLIEPKVGRRCRQCKRLTATSRGRRPHAPGVLDPSMPVVATPPVAVMPPASPPDLGGPERSGSGGPSPDPDPRGGPGGPQVGADQVALDPAHPLASDHSRRLRRNDGPDQQVLFGT